MVVVLMPLSLNACGHTAATDPQSGAAHGWTPTSAEQNYLNLLKGKGPRPRDVPWEDDQTLVAQGHKICANLPSASWAGNAQDEAQQLWTTTEWKYPVQQIVWQVTVAEETLCRDGG